MTVVAFRAGDTVLSQDNKQKRSRDIRQDVVPKLDQCRTAICNAGPAFTHRHTDVLSAGRVNNYLIQYNDIICHKTTPAITGR